MVRDSILRGINNSLKEDKGTTTGENRYILYSQNAQTSTVEIDVATRINVICILPKQRFNCYVYYFSSRQCGYYWTTGKKFTMVRWY